MSSNLDWQAIRTAYEGGTSSLSALEREFGVSRQAIKKRAIKEKWVTPQLQVTVTGNKQRVINRDVNAAQKVAMALEFRRDKLTYQEIADRCGYASAGACRNAIQRELERVVVENVNELRREESYNLDQWHAECSQMFFDKSNKGRLFALDRLLVISKHRRELFNLDKRPEEEQAQQNYTKRVILTHLPEGGTNASSS